MKKILLLLTILTLTACGAGKDKTNVELLQDMFDQPSLKAQDWDQNNDGKPALRVPPEGTMARNHTYYKYKGDFEGAEKNLKNPMAGKDMAPELMDRAKEHYTVYCGLCHGMTGKGDGQIAQHMPLKPPSLLSDKVRKFKDGRIYHIITEGQGVMGSYAGQIRSSNDRWAIVQYIRFLQKNGNN